MSPDLQAALNAALARAQAQQAPPAQNRLEHVAGVQQMMQALAQSIASRRSPLGKARVPMHPVPHHTNVDGGYSGAGVYGPDGQLTARAGFGPHPVPPMMYTPGMLPQPGVNYVQ